MSDKKRIKIALFIPNMVIGGVETVFANTIDSLLENSNYEIYVFSHGPIAESYYINWLKNRPQIKVFTVYKLSSLFEKYKGKFGFPLENIRKIIFSLYKKFCNHKIAQNKYLSLCDVIIDYVSGCSFKQLKYCKQPKITWLHCSINYARENDIPKRLNGYKRIVCISDSMKQDFSNECPQYTNKLIRIYNPIDYESIKKISIKAPKYPGNYFLCVGRMDADKDIATIIRAFNDFWINEHKPDIKMVFIGDGNIAKDMKKMADKTAAQKQFVFLGKIPQPYGYMRGAIAHILSSYNEGLPTVLIEAMATKTLNISSNCPNGPHEILQNGKAGLLFEPGNIHELSRIMSDVWNKKIDIQTLINNATKSLERFDPKSVSKQIVNLISNVINNN